MVGFMLHADTVVYHWDQRFLYGSEILEDGGASSQGESDQGDDTNR